MSLALVVAACSSDHASSPATPAGTTDGSAKAPPDDAAAPAASWDAGMEAAPPSTFADANADANADAALAVTPTLSQVKGRYTLAAGPVSVEIDPNVGGRVVALRLDGTDWLTGPDANATNYGSTFWTSPQSDWNWPPPPEIDTDPYAATVDGTDLVLQGKTSAALHLSVTKRFSIDATGDVVLAYTVTNHGSAARSFAAWEVTRVFPEGIFFFPSAGAGYSADSGAMLPVQQVGGAGWYSYTTATVPESIKYFADPSGAWLAQVRQGGLFIKRFPQAAAGSAAPGESPIEIFLDGAHGYVELETQGAYQSVAPGASLSWTSRWVLRKLPAGIDASAGGEALLSLVNSSP
jgi:hypothetical protein